MNKNISFYRERTKTKVKKTYKRKYSRKTRKTRKNKKSRKSRKNRKNRKLKGGSLNIDNFQQPTKPWENRLGAESPLPEVPELPLPKVPEYQRRKLVQLKKGEEMKEVYVGGFRDDVYGQDWTSTNWGPFLMWQFLNNRTKERLDLMSDEWKKRSEGDPGAVPTKEEVQGLALIDIGARGVWELSFDDEIVIDALKCFGIQLNEQKKLYLLIERSNSHTQQNCFPHPVLPRWESHWERQHLKPHGEWTKERGNYSRDIDMIFPFLEFNIKEDGKVEIITKPFVYLFINEKVPIFIDEFNDSFTIVSLIGVSPDGKEFGLPSRKMRPDDASGIKFKIVLEAKGKGITHKLMTELLGKLTIIKRHVLHAHAVGQPWICDKKIPDEEKETVWRVELAEPRLPLKLSKGQGVQEDRILYSVIGTGFDLKQFSADGFGDFDAEYRLNMSSEHDFLRKKFVDTYEPNELVKIRDMSQNPNSFTLKESGFCYVDMGEQIFLGKQNYHYSTKALMLLFNTMNSVPPDHPELKGLEGIFNDNKEILNLISHQLIRKIFGEGVVIKKVEHILEPAELNRYTLDIGGKTIMIEIKYSELNPFGYRKGAGHSFPTLHMDFGILNPVIKRIDLRNREDTIGGIVNLVEDNNRLINYWVNLTRDISSPEFPEPRKDTDAKGLFTEYKRTFDAYTKKSKGNPLYSNSLVLCDKKTTSETKFVELTGKVGTGQTVVKPINYKFTKDESGILPVTYDGLKYGCGFFFLAQEVIHSALTYTADSLAVFHDPLKVFEEKKEKIEEKIEEEIRNLDLDKMKEIVFSYSGNSFTKEQIRNKSRIIPIDRNGKTFWSQFLSRQGMGHHCFLEWKEKQKGKEIARIWRDYVGKKKKEEAVTKIQALARGRMVRKKTQGGSTDPNQNGGAYDPFQEVIRESFEVRFIVKITNEKNESLTNRYLGEPQIGEVFTTI